MIALAPGLHYAPDYLDRTDTSQPVDQSIAIGAFKQAVEGRCRSTTARRGPLQQALEGLEKTGVWAWFGSYERRVSMRRYEPEYALVRACSFQVPVIVLTPAGAETPEYHVDLSGNVGLGPTLEEVLAAEQISLPESHH